MILCAFIFLGWILDFPTHPLFILSPCNCNHDSNHQTKLKVASIFGSILVVILRHVQFCNYSYFSNVLYVIIQVSPKHCNTGWYVICVCVCGNSLSNSFFPYLLNLNIWEGEPNYVSHMWWDREGTQRARSKENYKLSDDWLNTIIIVVNHSHYSLH